MKKLLIAAWLTTAFTAQAVVTNLTWMASTSPNGVSGYKIFRSVGTAPFTLWTQVTVTSVTFDLDVTQTQRWYCVAWNAVGDSAQSNIETFTPVPPVPPGNTTNSLTLEGESATLVAPMLVRNDSTASGGKFVMSGINEAGTATFILRNLAAGTYVIWCLHRSPDGMSDSLYVSMDGSGNEDRYNTAQGVQGPTWQWSRVNGINAGVDPRIFTLSAGDHTLVFRQREANCGLDKIIVTSNQAFIPPPPTNQPPPVDVVPTAPSNLKLNQIDSSRLDVSWTSSLLASHEVERNEQNAGFKLRAALAPGNLHFSDSIRRRRNYAYRIRARNDAGASPYSLVATYNAP